jgi:hypothetical protein
MVRIHPPHTSQLPRPHPTWSAGTPAAAAHSVGLPAAGPLIDKLPRPVPLGQVTPGYPGGSFHGISRGRPAGIRQAAAPGTSPCRRRGPPNPPADDGGRHRLVCMPASPRLPLGCSASPALPYREVAWCSPGRATAIPGLTKSLPTRPSTASWCGGAAFKRLRSCVALTSGHGWLQRLQCWPPPV